LNDLLDSTIRLTSQYELGQYMNFIDHVYVDEIKEANQKIFH